MRLMVTEGDAERERGALASSWKRAQGGGRCVQERRRMLRRWTIRMQTEQEVAGNESSAATVRNAPMDVLDGISFLVGR